MAHPPLYSGEKAWKVSREPLPLNSALTGTTGTKASKEPPLAVDSPLLPETTRPLLHLHPVRT
jgi:hypothetical protein